MEAIITLLGAMAIMVGIGALIVKFSETDAGFSCCTGGTLVLLLAMVGCAALLGLIVVVLFGIGRHAVIVNS